MADEKLRRELIAFGYTPGPITDGTRRVLEKKLEKLRAEAKKPRNTKDNVRRIQHHHDSDDDDSWETHTSHRLSQTPKERAHGGALQADQRVLDSRYPGISTEESTLWKRKRVSLPGDKPQGSSMGSHRYLGDPPERSSLGSHRYSGDPPERSSLGYHRYSGDPPERSSLDLPRYSGDPPERSSLGYHRYSADEHTGDLGRSPYLSHSRTALDSLSYKTLPGLKQEKVSQLKSSWSRKLEYYLSRLLRALCVLLLLVFTGILIVKSGMLSTSQENGMNLLPSDCEGRKDTFCKVKQKEITLQILSELYDFLSSEAGNFECGNPSGLSSKCVPIHRAKEHVMNVSGYAAEKFDAALEWMLSSDGHLGIWAKGEDTEDLVTARADIFCVESSRPRLGFVCRLKNALYTAISNLFLALLGIFLLWIILIFLRYHWQRLEEEEKQMFVMVEKIIDAVKHHYKNWTFGREQQPYVGILHVRDSLIMPQERKHLKKVWDRAVRFVEDNESRVRTELQRVAGADLRVWQWTQTGK